MFDMHYLDPFSKRFAAAFSSWVRSKYRASSQALLQTLLQAFIRTVGFNEGWMPQTISTLPVMV